MAKAFSRDSPFRPAAWWRFALFLCLVGSSVHAAPAWVRLQADGFVIYSDASEKDVVEFALGYEAYRQVFQELFVPPGRTPPQMTLILFRRGNTLRKYGPVMEDDKQLLTYTFQVDDAAAFAVSLSGDRKRALQVAYEFETIWALRRLGYFVPIWMSQGTGMVLGSLELRKGRCVIGDLSGDQLEFYLEATGELPWKDLFELGRDSPQYTGEKLPGVYQTQSWALMNWILLRNQNPRAAFENLTAKLKEMSAIDAVRTVTGEEPNTFTRSIARHLKTSAAQYSRPFDIARAKSSIHVSPATDVEVGIQLSNILAAAGRIAEADAELDRLAATQPQPPLVLEALARRALRNDDSATALRLYREAIEAGTTNTRAYLYSAGAWIDESRYGKMDMAGEGGPTTEHAVKEIRKAIELNPGSSEAYRLLGRAFFVLPKVGDEHVAELSQGVRAGEDGSRVRWYRALLYSRLKKNAEYQADLQALVDDPDAPQRIRSQAEDRLQRLKNRARR